MAGGSASRVASPGAPGAARAARLLRRLRRPGPGRPVDRPQDSARETLLSGRLGTLAGIARRLTRSLETEQIFRAIADEARRALDADATVIRIVRGERLELVAWSGISDELASRLPRFAVQDGWFGEIARTGRPLAIEDVRLSVIPDLDRYPVDVPMLGTLVVPLVHDERIIGSLSYLTRAPRQWSTDDVEFSSALAAHASIAIHTAELFERTESRAAQLAVLHAASARMSRARTDEEIGRAIVDETRRIVDYHDARVDVLHDGSLVPIGLAGPTVEAAGTAVRFTGWVAERREPILVDDARTDPRAGIAADADGPEESLLVVPIRTDVELLGVVSLTKLGLRQFGDDDLRLVTTLADQAATALESIRLVSRSEGFAREMQRLVEMSGDLSRSLDPRQVADLIADHLARALGVDECVISYWDRPGGRVETLGIFPPSPPEGLEPSFEVAEFPETRRVLETRATVVVDTEDPAADPAEVALLRRDGNRVLAMLPLVAKGEAIGLAELLSKSPIAFDSSALALARTMLNEAAMALENARLYEQARMLADRDPLTGFFNHRYLHERLGEEIVRAQRARRPVSLLMIDLDDFKLVNDTFGHLFGDRVLVWVAEQIRSVLRTTDVPARYGGDEFAVILPDAAVEAAARAAERITDAFRDRAFEAEGRGPLPIAVSIGVACYPLDGRSGPQLIATADEALYVVKRAGGASVAVANAPSAEARGDGDEVDAA